MTYYTGWEGFDMAYTIGVDFGTLSGRAVLVNVRTGEEIASAVKRIHSCRHRPYAAEDGRKTSSGLGASASCRLYRSSGNGDSESASADGH